MSADGPLLASSRDLPADRADQLAAVPCGVVSPTEGASRIFNVGKVQQTIIEMDNSSLFIVSVNGGSSMAVMAARGCNLDHVGAKVPLGW